MIIKYGRNNRCVIHINLSCFNMTERTVFNIIADKLLDNLSTRGLYCHIAIDYYTSNIRVYDLDDTDPVDYFIYQINNVLDSIITIHMDSNKSGTNIKYDIDIKYVVDYSNGESYCITKENIEKEDKE